MNPSKAKRRANRNKRKHRDQATRRKTGAEKRPEQLELPVSMPERGAAKSEPQAKTKDPSQHKTKAAAKTDPASSPRFQVASEKAAGAEHKVLPRKPKSAQYATVRPAKTSRPVVNTAGLSIPASDQQSKPASPVWRLYAAMLFTALLTVWFSQDSINAYWQQTYHRASPLEKLNDYGWWRSGSSWQQAALSRHEAALGWLEAKNESWRQQHTTEHTPPDAVVMPTVPTVPSEAESKPASAPTVAQQNTASKPLPERVQLSAGDKVFFAGDSMMEGVAPHVQKWLSSQYGIDSLNLSKQSTGLSYPSFFDWPATIEKTLREDRKIRLLVVFLGPNDPWDFPNPEPGTRGYLKFQSPEWEQVYRQRIERILAAAQAADVKVIWLGVPLMKSSRLNAQMRYLDRLFASELAGKTIWLPTDKIMGGEDGQYRDSISINGQTVRLRSKDGIHFTVKGQQLLAEQIAGRIDYQPAPTAPAVPAASETVIAGGKP